MADLPFERAHRKGVKLKCEGKPELYVDFKPAARPSPEGAQRLCSGCPVIRESFDKALNLPAGAADGVYGGFVFIEGEIQTD